MRTLQSILLATDFRPASHEAATVAARFFGIFGSRLTLLNTLEPMPDAPVPEHWQRNWATEQLAALTDQLIAQQAAVADSVVVTGPCVQTILSKATELNVDLIVLGAGERDRHDRFSLGPIATAILERAVQPVLAVRPGEPATQFRKILCPVDQSSASARGLRNAIHLAQAFKGEVVVISVVPEINWLSAALETGQFSDAKTEHMDRWEREFEQFLLGIPTHEVKITKQLRHGSAHKEILAAVQEYGADVLVMGATGRTGMTLALLGSTTRRVLEHLPCSILTVKDEGAISEPDDAEVRLIRMLLAEGKGLLAANSSEAALAKFRQVINHDRFNIEATTGIAEAYAKLGNSSLADYYHRRAAELRW